MKLIFGRVIAQAVSRRLPTVAAPVRAQVRSCGICSGQSGAGAGFLRVFRFPLPVLIPPTAPHSSSSRFFGEANDILEELKRGYVHLNSSFQVGCSYLAATTVVKCKVIPGLN
jgi:hypothetical protein